MEDILPYLVYEIRDEGISKSLEPKEILKCAFETRKLAESFVEYQATISDVKFKVKTTKKIQAKNISHTFVQEHRKKLLDIKNSSLNTTVVINAYGGAGAGKTTACLEIAKELKKRGFVTEYVQEYPKELVWEERFDLLDGTKEHQFDILGEQLKRMDRLYGKVDFIVTDSPILLNQIYNKELTPEYESMLTKLYSQYDNFNFVVERDPDPTKFEKQGRIHSLKESVQKDSEVKQMLDKSKLYYGTYNHSTIGKIVDNSIKTHERVSEGCNQDIRFKRSR